VTSNDQLPEGQGLVDHLTELRVRIMRILWILIIGSSLGWIYSDQIFAVIRHPVKEYLPSGGLVYTGIMDKFMAYIQISILSGVILTCPLWLYQVWGFIAPGLYKNEKKYAVGFLSFGTVMFLIGISFVYFVVYPSAFHYLLNFGGTEDRPMITIDAYLSFFITTTLIFGAAFELPLVLVILGMMGVIDQKFLREKRRYAVVALSVFSAVITPPDLMSMLFLLGPLILLYEMSIFIVGAMAPKAVARE
jgi:sec-independent protein translocase protein TatC